MPTTAAKTTPERATGTPIRVVRMNTPSPIDTAPVRPLPTGTLPGRTCALCGLPSRGRYCHAHDWAAG